jgi:hypothetical protein
MYSVAVQISDENSLKEKSHSGHKPDKAMSLKHCIGI